jgi:hypothetical protein
MPKSRGRKPPGDRRRRRAQSRAPSPPPPPPQVWRQRVLLRLLKWVRQPLVWLVTALSVAGSVATLYPRVSVTPQGPIDLRKPAPVAFDILNSGIAPLDDVRMAIGICRLNFYGPPAISIVGDRGNKNECQGPLAPTNITFKNYPRQRLSHDERWTIGLSDYPALAAVDVSEPASLSLSVIVTYKPWPWPFHRTSEFKYETRAGTDGRLDWYALPVNAPTTPQDFTPDMVLVLGEGSYAK